MPTKNYITAKKTAAFCKDTGEVLLMMAPSAAPFGILLTASYLAGAAVSDTLNILGTSHSTAGGVVAGMATAVFSSLYGSSVAERIEDPVTPLEKKLSAVADRWFSEGGKFAPSFVFCDTLAHDVVDTVVTTATAGLIAAGLMGVQYGVEKAIGTAPTFNSISAPQPAAGKSSAITLPNGRVAKISGYKPSMA